VTKKEKGFNSPGRAFKLIQRFEGGEGRRQLTITAMSTVITFTLTLPAHVILN
jgi:hypothetical protein